MSTLDERHERERAFHDRWAEGIDLDALLVREAFEAVTAAENRCSLDFLSPLAGKTLLDLGCGAGETSVYFALQGARVTGVDISPQMLRVSERLAAKHGVAVATQVVAAEALPFPDASFDIVFGNGVLHHVDFLPALREVRRVLKPDGKAAFIEPLKHNPLIGVYRRLAGANRTEDERPLGMADLRRIREEVFPGLEHREFWLFTLYLFVHFFLVERLSPGKVRYWKKIIEDADKYAALYGRLRRLDDAALRAIPWLGRWCWNSVLMARKPA